MGTYRNVIAWQKSFLLACRVYEVTKTFPREERFGLTSQMRRAAVSIPSNIAEGFHRKTTKEYAYYCSIAYASSAELATQLAIAKEIRLVDLAFIDSIQTMIEEVQKILGSLCASLHAKARHS